MRTPGDGITGTGWWWLALLALLLGGYWFLPISGQVIIDPGADAARTLWPQFNISPANPQMGDTVTVSVTDDASWAHVLLTVDGRAIPFDRTESQPVRNTWTWHWTYTLPTAPASPTDGELIFYTDCDTGCRARGRATLGQGGGARGQNPGIPQASGLSTKLCTVLANPQRDWRNRRGWVVEVAYARLADNTVDQFWRVDALAWRVQQAQARGLRVLVRVDYDRQQTLPPVDDFLALNEYLAFVRRLARDDRLAAVYGYIIGSGANADDANALAPEQPITPAWYARVFSGYGEPVEHVDNVVQTIHAERPQVRVLVGPVRPWVNDQDGPIAYAMDAPWLNYFYSLVSFLDATSRAKAAAGYALAAPDGFALQAPGRPEAPELAGQPSAGEPRLDLLREEWNDAQAGFRVYRNWLDIINVYPTTRGLPAYITASNTFVPDGGTPPAQNYPQGWLSAALAEIDAEPQVHALCWFLDLVPGDDAWDAFSLTRKPGRMVYAAEEFDSLLRTE